MNAAALLAAIAAIAACVGVWECGNRLSVLMHRATQLLTKVPGVRLLSPSPDLRDRMVAAGGPAGLRSGDWIALKWACALLAGLGALALSNVAPGRMPILLITAAPIAGFLAPDRWLLRLTRRRLDAAVRELPDMLDVFRVTVEAGMPVTRALAAVASEFDGPLAREWRRAAVETTLGVPQEEALAALARRLPADEIRSFVEALDRSRRRGVPIGRAAAAQATVARHHRRRRVRDQAARAGPKIQLVVALLLVPSVLLLVAAGVVAELERSPLQAFPT